MRPKLFIVGPLIVWLLHGLVVCEEETENSTHDDVVVSEERRLINYLLERYDRIGKIARPRKNSRDHVAVEFGIRLVHLDLDEKEQVMKTSVWMRMKWIDEYLQWNPADYGGVAHITIPASKVWIPDIVLVNSAETEVKELTADLQVSLNGQVFWAPQRKYSSACLIDVTEYPFDRHTCSMWFQSIANRRQELNLTAYSSSPLDLDTYLTSYKFAQEWEIIENSTFWCERPRDVGMILMYSRRSALRFTLTVQRRPGFLAMVLIVPCALLSFLIPLVFCFPPERPDRHSLAMSLFASLTFLLFMVNEIAPPSAAFVPRLALYYSFNLVILLVATCCSAVVVNISRRGETRDRVPRWVRTVFLKYLGRLLCFGNRLKHLTEVKRASRRCRSQERRAHNTENGEVTEYLRSAEPEAFPSQYAMSETAAGTSAQEENPVLLILNKKLSTIESRLQEQNADPRNQVAKIASVPVDIRMEWRTLSLVLDRLFFVVFLLTDLISLGVFHPRAELF